MTFKIFSTLAATCLMAAFSFSQVKKPEPSTLERPFENSLQVMVVTTPDWSALHGTAALFKRKNTESEWKRVNDEFSVVVGKNGLGVMIRPGIVDNGLIYKDGRRPAYPAKIEGDGRSPAGFFPLTSTFGIADVGSKLPFTKLDEFTECVDDTNSSFYNKIVNRMQVGNFDWKSSEKMFTVRPQYDLGVFVGYNSYPPVRGNGSCIFLHIWKDADTGTAGCTAMARENLERVIRWLDPAKNPYLVQMTLGEYLSQRKYFKLPKIN